MSKKDTERYYLLPGMGGAARNRKVRAMLVWGLLVGLIVGSFMALVMYWVHMYSRLTP